MNIATAVKVRLKIKIPFPPTANHIWARGGKRTYLTKEYQSFLKIVSLAIKRAEEARPLFGANAYAVRLVVYPPDRRVRDLDNLIKPVLDALTRAGLWLDDSRVCMITACKGAPAEEPFAVVEITALHEQPEIDPPELYGEKTRKYKK